MTMNVTAVKQDKLLQAYSLLVHENSCKLTKVNTLKLVEQDKLQLDT